MTQAVPQARRVRGLAPAWESRGLHVRPGHWGLAQASLHLPGKGSVVALGQTNANELEEMENIKSFLWQENQEQAARSQGGFRPGPSGFGAAGLSMWGGGGGGSTQRPGGGNPHVRACRRLIEAPGSKLERGAGNGLRDPGERRVTFPRALHLGSPVTTGTGDGGSAVLCISRDSTAGN